MLKKIVNSPFVNILAGMILLAFSGYEILDISEESAVGAHHGVFIFALIHILKSIPEILHGLDDLEKAKEGLGS